MKAVIQRVSEARVSLDDVVVSKIGQGLLILLGVGHDDTEEDINQLVKKIVAMRIFNDEQGIMNFSVKDIKGDIIVVSQFTLMADARRGNRPSYIKAAPRNISKPLYDTFCEKLSVGLGKRVGCGVFGADMQVQLINDGPVTITLDTKQLVKPDEPTYKFPQQEVDKWIKTIGKGYFSELTNMTILTEEVGELARIFARRYGDQIAKSTDIISNEHLADEMADVLWVLFCLANQTDTDLSQAFEKNLEKKTKRDRKRF